MNVNNSAKSYGLVTIFFHWIIAFAVIGLFSLGLWMEGLDYYSPWYQTAPHLHKSIGVVTVMLMLARLFWRLFQIKPAMLSTHHAWERRLANLAQWLFYILIISMFFSGYFITTAKGNSLEVFNWFAIVSVIDNVNRLEDIAGEIHKYSAFCIIGLAVIHTLGALKHHFFDKDATLFRMLGKSDRK